jgi:hypothetical protein
MEDQKPALGEGARIYIGSLTDEDARQRAVGYANMPRDEFQARFGPAVDAIDKKLTAILECLTPRAGGVVVRFAESFEQSMFVKVLTAAILTAVAAMGKKVSE